jgi:1-aminocyclopropane-1-carboxylate deaminase/D-cysteine desulfhydrase-like pyridoxal-dependent ACC family enzyme
MNAGNWGRAIFQTEMLRRLGQLALCGGFGRFTPELVALCERVEAEAGLSLDPIFGGKTWSVMERHLDREKPRDGDVLYWHCGYTPEF